MAVAQRLDALAVGARHLVQAAVAAAIHRDGAVVDLDVEGLAVFGARVAPGFADRHAVHAAVQQFLDARALFGREVRRGTPASRGRRTAPGLRVVGHRGVRSCCARRRAGCMGHGPLRPALPREYTESVHPAVRKARFRGLLTLSLMQKTFLCQEN
ncbi:hypothetical protein D3C72_1776650 [compost metagenome]